MMFLIYCCERKRWWLPNEHGYTSSFLEAGRYSKEHATRITQEANQHSDTIQEVMVPESLLVLFGTSELERAVFALIDGVIAARRAGDPS